MSEIDLADIPDEALDAALTEALVAVIQASDSPTSFGAFYMLITGTLLPSHASRWVDAIYDAKARDRGVLLWAFRGSWKTTTITMLFTAYRIGKEPQRANLIVQANDSSAEMAASAIARIIEHSPGWKKAFPNVVPDPDRRWGAAGYDVKRTDIEYEEWVAQSAARKDPTLLGMGYNSSSAIGKHPDGVFIIDDIHDERNTASDRERQSVIRILTDTLLPMLVEDVTRAPGQRLVTWEIAVGTPWTEDDAYHYLRNTGEFDFLNTPVMIPADEGENIVEFDHKALKGTYDLKWPERFPQEVIISWYNKSGHRGFFRMYLLDLSGAKETGLKYQTVPSETIDTRWPAAGGVDYATTIELAGRVIDERNRSKFALAYGVLMPTGGAVIQDGVVGHVTQLQAEGHVERAQGIWPNWVTCAVEMDGKGEEFFSLLSRKPLLRLLPFWTGGRGKKNRHERELGPWLEMGLVKISDADTPFLNLLRKSLDDWPHGNMDVIDAVYAYCKTIPHILQVPLTTDQLPRPTSRHKVKKPNPFVALGQKVRADG